jgi:hypothetical protein
MKNINDKIKKRIAIASCFAVCIVLVVLIGSRFIPEKSAEQVLPLQSDQSSDVTVNSDTEKKVVVAAPKTSLPGITDNGADSTGTEQTIQGDVSKPPAPSKDQLADPSQKPNTSSKPSNSTDTGSTPADDSSQSGGGLPGFDNVPNAGPNQVIEVDGDGDINKQVGEM